MSDILVLDKIARHFAHNADIVRAVDDVTLNIKSCEFFTLLGPSGCGKTTLLRLIAGLEAATAGRIILDGQDIAPLPAYRRPVNTVFQSYALFPHMTVAENIAFGMKMQKRPTSEINDGVTRALKLVQMEAMKDRKPAQLSGGQQQRVALARALVNKPKILLLDESLSALDYKLRKEMQIELKRLQRETGTTFIFVTHDQDEALSMSDRIAVMSKGRVAQIGSPQDIYMRPQNRFVADFIGICNFVKPETLNMSGADPLGFRPEDAEFVSAVGASAHHAAGTVSAISYRGPVTHYLVDLKSGERVTVAEDTPLEHVRVGLDVALFVPPERIIRCGA